MADSPLAVGPGQPAPVGVDVQYRAGTAIVRLAGALTAQTAPTLRVRLLQCLADCPDALVLDVAGLVVLGVNPDLSR